jgi:hypothetical protein
VSNSIRTLTLNEATQAIEECYHYLLHTTNAAGKQATYHMLEEAMQAPDRTGAITLEIFFDDDNRQLFTLVDNDTKLPL